jgi:hypothetical protein
VIDFSLEPGIICPVTLKFFEIMKTSAIHLTWLSPMMRTLKNGVFWDVTPCGSSKNPRFGGT